MMAQVEVQTPASGPNAVDAPASVPGSGNAAINATALYVGDLDMNVTDSQLYDLFNQINQVVSVRVCRDTASGRSLGYGYVNFSNPDDGKTYSSFNGLPADFLYVCSY